MFCLVPHFTVVIVFSNAQGMDGGGVRPDLRRTASVDSADYAGNRAENFREGYAMGAK